MPTATASKPYYSYEARRTLAGRADRDAAVRRELERFERLVARAAAQAKAAVAVELARFRAFEAKYGPVKPTPKQMHKMQDASGKWWQSTSLDVLRKHVAERNRLISSPGYRYVMGGLEEGRRRAARLYPRG